MILYGSLVIFSAEKDGWSRLCGLFWHVNFQSAIRLEFSVSIMSSPVSDRMIENRIVKLLQAWCSLTRGLNRPLNFFQPSIWKSCVRASWMAHGSKTSSNLKVHAMMMSRAAAEPSNRWTGIMSSVGHVGGNGRFSLAKKGMPSAGALCRADCLLYVN